MAETMATVPVTYLNKLMKLEDEINDTIQNEDCLYSDDLERLMKRIGLVEVEE